mmetsp:Transcript_47553/g.133889  ORF Transcript_47553/g.133889 Transcript_47553/m.133889 type:complete len:344 (+) Transcript_47553:1191-2222(+)
MHGHRVPARLPVVNRARHWPRVDDAARLRSEQQELVEQLRDLHARLMDDHEHEHGDLLADDAQGLDAELGVGGREPGGRLVGEEQRGPLRHAAREGDAPALPPGAAAHLVAADVGVGDTHEAEGREQQVQRLVSKVRGHVRQTGRLQPPIELHRLPDLPVLRHDVVLADVRGDALEEAVPRVAVHQDLALEPRGLLPRQHVQQRALPTAAWAHDRHHLPRLEVARDRLQDHPAAAARLRQRVGEVLEGHRGGGPLNDRRRDHRGGRQRVVEERLRAPVLLGHPLQELLAVVVPALPRRRGARDEAAEVGPLGAIADRPPPLLRRGVEEGLAALRHRRVGAARA